MSDPKADARETVDLIGATVTFIPEGGASSYSLIEWVAKVGAVSPPVHIHHETDESFYVMSGTFVFLLDGVETLETAGAHVVVPMGRPHTFWNAAGKPAKCLVIISPPGFEAYFRELATLLSTAESEEEQTEARVRLSAKYDIEVVGPPRKPGRPHKQLAG
ncbi:MAG TPA: cupin domain-containing protein [Candidatus Dormibacteraeota bacterium]